MLREARKEQKVFFFFEDIKRKGGNYNRNAKRITIYHQAIIFKLHFYITFCKVAILSCYSEERNEKTEKTYWKSDEINEKSDCLMDP